MVPAAVGIAALASALYVSWPAFAAGGFPLDDAWITQSIARNLAKHGVWGFNPERASSGATSILWTLLLAAAQWAGVSPVASTLAVSSLLFAGFCIVLHSILRADGTGPGADAAGPMATGALALLPAALGNGVWLTATGLEPLLLSFLSAVAVRLWQTGSAWTGAACALAALTRPEGLGIGVVLSAYTLVERRRRPAPPLLWSLAPVAAAWTAGSLLFLTTGGHVLPLTLEGRRWLLHLYRPEGWRGGVDFAQSWAYQLGQNALGLPPALAWCALAVVAAASVVAILRGGGAGVMASWGLAWNALYLVILPTPGHGGRYQPLNLLLAPVLAALAIAVLLARFRPRWKSWCFSAAALAVGLPCLVTLPVWRGITRAGVNQIEQVHRTMAAQARTLVPPDATIAAFDIGALRYFGEHEVVDLGGLVDAEFLPYLRQGRVPEYLDRRGVTWVALPEDWRNGIPGGRLGYHLRLLENPAFPLQSVAVIRGDPLDWERAYTATGHALPRLVLYRRIPIGSAPPSRVPPGG